MPPDCYAVDGQLGPINRFFQNDLDTKDEVVMSYLPENELDKAITFLTEARKILFEQLHEPGARTRELVDGLDKLASAFDLVEDPERLLYICPACESLASEKRDDGAFHCFSCDKVWQQKQN